MSENVKNPAITKKDLEELCSNRRYILTLLRQINAYEKASKHRIWDVVKESRHDVRANMHIITIGANRAKNIEIKLEELKNSYDKYSAIVERVESWIERIEDTDAKSIMELRYIQGLTFKEIATILWPTQARSEDYPRKCIHDKYLREHKIV